MHTQNGLNRALWEQDGFQSHSRHNSAQIKWERRENAFLESLCEARGLKVDHPMIEGAKHLETKVYKAEKQLEEAEREAAEIEKQMGPTRAEYEALKEYINAMQINYNLIDGVKENKTITGKIRSYDVPKDVWETQKITKAERDAQERARARWEKLVKDYPEISREYEKLLQGNAEKAETIARVNETLRNMSESARSEFFGLFNATRREKVAEHEKAPGTQKNEPREPEER